LGRLQRAGLASGGGGRSDSNAGETVARHGQHAAQGGSIGPREEVGSFEWCRTRVEGKLTEVASMAYGGARCCARARSTASFFYRRADRRWGNASSLSIHSEYAMGTACAGTSARAQQVGGRHCGRTYASRGLCGSLAVAPSQGLRGRLMPAPVTHGALGRLWYNGDRRGVVRAGALRCGNVVARCDVAFQRDFHSKRHCLTVINFENSN
jgi:hypothetical protein